MKKGFFYILVCSVAIGCKQSSPTKTPSEAPSETYTGQGYPDEKYTGIKDPLIDSIIMTNKAFFEPYLKNADQYRIQIIYTQINRDEKNEPQFTHYFYRYLPDEHFNPASLVKLPTLLIALEKLKKLNIEGLNRETPLAVGTSRDCQEALTSDSTAPGGRPTIGHIARQMMLVSDDKAYSKMYEFCGQEYLNRRLGEAGWQGARIVYRFASNCGEMENRYTNPFIFFSPDSSILYEQPAAFHENYSAVKEAADKDKKFSGSGNYLPLWNMHTAIASLVFPENKTFPFAFDLRPEDLEMVRKYIALYPREAEYPMYNPAEYIDSYCIYFLYGHKTRKIDGDSVRVFNMVGQSHGWLSDIAYIADFTNNREFMLSAVVLGKDESGAVQYESIGFPFLRELGKVFLEYERNRTYKRAPDLTELKALLSTSSAFSKN